MKRRADFARVKNTGQAKVGRFVILSTLEDRSLVSLSPGFITTKHSASMAHDRNLLRRRFRSFVQVHAPGFSEIRRFLVTIARPGASHASFAELEADWLRQARRLGLFPRPEEKP
jgi:ribonuclease P protein component